MKKEIIKNFYFIFVNEKEKKRLENYLCANGVIIIFKLYLQVSMLFSCPFQPSMDFK